MAHSIDIAKSAVIERASLEPNNLVIEADAKITDVIIKGRKIHIKSGAILTKSKIFSDGKVVVGNRSEIKPDVMISAFRNVIIGDRTIIDRDVTVGGTQSEKSEFIVGDDSAILYRAYLNTTRKISVGNNSGVGGYANIFTHSSWHNALRGGSYKFGDVTISDNVWIGWNVTILPGVLIENDAAIGAGAVVTRNVPQFSVVVGVPAKVIKTRTRDLSRKQKDALFKKILKDFSIYASEFLKIRNAFSTDKTGTRCVIELVKKNGSRATTKLSYYPIFPKNSGVFSQHHIIISFQIPYAYKGRCQWIELDSLETNSNAEIVQYFSLFIRRYGLRIKRV
jgi:acetyltransferase-like isoleucine patch superfamily enzyme